MAHRSLLLAATLIACGCTVGRGVSTSDGSPDAVNPAGCPDHRSEAQGVCTLSSSTRCNYSSGSAGCDELTWSCSCEGGRWRCLEGRKQCPPDGGLPCPSTLPEVHESCSLPVTARCEYLYSHSRCDYLDLYWHCACENGRWSCFHDFEDCFRGDAGPMFACPATQPQGGTFCELDEISTCVYYVGDGPGQVWYCDCKQSRWSCYQVMFGDGGI